MFQNDTNLNDGANVQRFAGPKNPWRRFFAWSFDTSLYSILWVLLSTLVFRISTIKADPLESIISAVIGILLNIVFEPIFLSKLGTTPGKWLFGLSVKDINGEKLQLVSAFYRTLSKLWYGTGLGIPIYNLYRFYKSGRACEDGEFLPWEFESNETIKDTRNIRCVFYVFSQILIIALIVFIDLQGILPPHRGDITAEQFADNYNYTTRYFKGNKDMLLTAEGTWKKISHEESGVVYIDTFPDVPDPKFNITESNGIVTSVSFSVDIESNDTWVPPYSNYMNMAVISFLGAQKNISVFDLLYNDILKQIYEQSFDNFNIQYKGITIRNTVKKSGYQDLTSDILVPEDNSVGSLDMTFTITKE